MFVRGVLDSINFPFPLFIIYGSPKLASLALRSSITTICVFILGWMLKLALIYTIGHDKLIITTFSTILSSVLNTNTSRLMAIETRLLLGGQIQKQRTKLSELLSMLPNMVHQVYKSILFTIFILLSASYYYYLPVIGQIFGIFHLGMMWSLICFEPCFSSLGWKLPRMIKFFEERWLYFMGFGLVFGSTLYLIPSAFEFGVFPFLYPLVLLVNSIA